MKNPAPGFILLILLVSCTSQSPLVSDPVVPSDPTVEMPEAPEPSRSPLSPAQARTALSERGVPYSQRSFLSAVGQGDLEVVRLFVEAGMAVDAQTENEGYDTALMRAAGGGQLVI